MSASQQHTVRALHVSYMDRERQEWVALAAFPLRPSATSSAAPANAVELANEDLVLPNGESLQFSVAFVEFNCSTTVHVQGSDKTRGQTTLLFVGGFKSSISNYDPTAHFLTPGGLHVQVMVGPVSAPT